MRRATAGSSACLPPPCMLPPACLPEAAATCWSSCGERRQQAGPRSCRCFAAATAHAATVRTWRHGPRSHKAGAAQSGRQGSPQHVNSGGGEAGKRRLEAVHVSGVLEGVLRSQAARTAVVHRCQAPTAGVGHPMCHPAAPNLTSTAAAEHCERCCTRLHLLSGPIRAARSGRVLPRPDGCRAPHRHRAMAVLPSTTCILVDSVLHGLCSCVYRRKWLMLRQISGLSCHGVAPILRPAAPFTCMPMHAAPRLAPLPAQVRCGTPATASAAATAAAAAAGVLGVSRAALSHPCAQRKLPAEPLAVLGRDNACHA